mmetsp:Transcript_25900/g.40206  ORF Transcript_25900/g.40206 Transcript_25900/m.40206 type:complete len:446 (+) Transcript_25900:83-1420(+)|eukprot:CAMPEP_0196801008 /NCGR_PEP_ID=MMETSP1362-20130617/626_1 /TAXON_ID=163516 /ORGANISM="Leptocylindrus danicus, Strain CCMP1856" /LENGTH=445 /DNA_ID=CAMNT_0042171677 /DNA_START=62 /DNA_END=1399 /DNA_ORIENTATION=+
MTSLADTLFGGSTGDNDNSNDDKSGGLFDKKVNLPTPTTKEYNTEKKHLHGATKIVKGGKKRMRELRRKLEEAQTAGAGSVNDVERKTPEEEGNDASSSSSTESDSDGSSNEGEDEGAKAKNEKQSKEVDNDEKEDEDDEEEGLEDRTIFVGNLPGAITRKELARLFADCGKVTSTRIRSVAVKGVKLPKEQAGNQNLMRKVCANTNLVDEDSKKTVNGYVVFADTKSVQEALKLNNMKEPNSGLHLRVDSSKPTYDNKRSVFVGNLPYGIMEEQLRKHFGEACGGVDNIENVRIVRDNETMKCKGFAYVLFKSRDIVAEALRLHGSTCAKREIRVQVCGRRYKGARGNEDDNAGGRNANKYEGRRATEGATKRILNKMKGKREISSKATLLPHKKRKTHSERNAAAKSGKKSGVSRRDAAQAKVNKRVKKIEKRIRTGMGKTKR